MRTHNNGELRIDHVGQEVTLIGWVAKRRNLGSMVFIDLRDRYGITQLVFDEEHTTDVKSVRNEYVIQVVGKVQERRDANDKLATGDIEVVVDEINIVNTAETTPLIIADETDALEAVRFKYRYLDLRRPEMQKNMMVRHQITHSIRNFLDERDFVDIETPMLGKSTPEGARDFLVPSRNYPGEFYALPQSPQLYKQLLMMSGFERYYQIAKCFRDEDLRADRQLEFTQVDIEMSFMSEAQIKEMMESLLATVMKEVKGIDIETPFRDISFFEALDRYGSDKPDTRFGMELVDVTDNFKETEFKVLQGAIKNDGVIKAIVVPEFANLTRRELDELVDIVKANGGMGILDLKYLEGKIQGNITRFFSEDEISGLENILKPKENDLILMVSGAWETTCIAIGAVRSFLAHKLEMIDKSKFDFLWVSDFPLLEYDEEEKRYFARHHPFTRVKDEDWDKLDTNPGEAKAYAYDVILNGYELGGGSLRNYTVEQQTKTFEVLGFSEEQIQSQFGFFVDAFKYGTPPHGGLAFGLDRLAMILCHKESIRDVIAFPKTANARCPMMDAPSLATDAQLAELSLKVDKTKIED